MSQFRFLYSDINAISVANINIVNASGQKQW